MGAPSTLGETRILEVLPLGLRAYDEVLALQEARVEARHRGEVPDALIFCEHPPVVTVGRGGGLGDVRGDLGARGIALREVARGGELTYHGPGQLVAYPVIELRPSERDLHRLLRGLEEVAIRALADFGLAAGRRAGHTGVWVGACRSNKPSDESEREVHRQGATSSRIDGEIRLRGATQPVHFAAGRIQAAAPIRLAAGKPSRGRAAEAQLSDRLLGPRKLASLGIALRHWVTYHGVAINVDLDLAPYRLIRPCGLDPAVMTSMAREGARPATVADIAGRFETHFRQVMDRP